MFFSSKRRTLAYLITAIFCISFALISIAPPAYATAGANSGLAGQQIPVIDPAKNVINPSNSHLPTAGAPVVDQAQPDPTASEEDQAAIEAADDPTQDDMPPISVIPSLGGSGSGNAVSEPPPGTEAPALEPADPTSSSELGVQQVGIAASDGALTKAATTTTTANNILGYHYIAAGTPYATKMYIIKSPNPGPVFLVTGGTHGNELSGPKAAQLMTQYRVKRGTLLVVPQLNRLADISQTRSAPVIGDLNRSFPTSSTGTPNDVLARAIWSDIQKYKVQWIIDLHEGYYYHRSTPSSVGQSLIYYPMTGSYNVGLNAVRTVNAGISVYGQKFSYFPKPLESTLTRSAGQFLGMHTFELETCRLDSMSKRIAYDEIVIKSFLKQLGMM